MGENRWRGNPQLYLPEKAPKGKKGRAWKDGNKRDIQPLERGKNAG